METKYKLIGITEYAERWLSEEDIETLKEMIGCEVYESKKKSHIDKKIMFIMPDGEETHIDFLQIEEIHPTFNFNIETK
jgi:glutamine amidotransferase PdxT